MTKTQNSNQSLSGERVAHHKFAFRHFLLIVALGMLAVLYIMLDREVRQLRAVRTGAELAATRNLNHRLVKLRHGLKMELQSEMAQLKAQVSAAPAGPIVTAKNPQSSREIVADVSGAICLIQGEYLFLDPETKLPLRYVETQTHDDNLLDDRLELDPMDSLQMDVGNTESGFGVSVYGQGNPWVIQYTGTGFLVDRSGHVVTNKHVVTPWEVRGDYDEVLAEGYQPYRCLFRAFFPGHAEPFVLEVVACSDANDVALLQVDLESTTITPLTCARDPQGLRAGETVIVMGYPTGFDVLMARLNEHELAELAGPQGWSFDVLARNMARQGLIQPLATRGMCGGVHAGKILYDAQTAIGGSGGPVVDSRGHAVAINTALLKGFAGTNFGIPIQHALTLLEQAEPFTTGTLATGDAQASAPNPTAF